VVVVQSTLLVVLQWFTLGVAQWSWKSGRGRTAIVATPTEEDRRLLNHQNRVRSTDDRSGSDSGGGGGGGASKLNRNFVHCGFRLSQYYNKTATLLTTTL